MQKGIHHILNKVLTQVKLPLYVCKEKWDFELFEIDLDKTFSADRKVTGKCGFSHSITICEFGLNLMSSFSHKLDMETKFAKADGHLA